MKPNEGAEIPTLDVAPLFGPDSPERQRVDESIQRSAGKVGFLVLTGLPSDVPLGSTARTELLRIFSMPSHTQRRLWRRNAAPENPNVYRGYFPLESGVIKEGVDLGPDPVPPAVAALGPDALTEPTPFPDETILPGWRAGVRRAFTSLEGVGRALMRSLARGLGLPDAWFDEAFRDGNSTLRIIEYPPWPEVADAHGWTPRLVDSTRGARRYDMGGEHVDSGLVTLLQQDTVGGLQARSSAGDWIDVSPRDDALVVNFGKLLERWSGGRIRATEHRVLGNDRARHSIPFFYEPRVDAEIAPMPIAGAKPFEPFHYGDHLWSSMTEFVEFAGLSRFPDRS